MDQVLCELLTNQRLKSHVHRFWLAITLMVKAQTGVIVDLVDFDG